MMRVPHPSLFLKLNRIESCALCGAARCRRPAAHFRYIYLIVPRCELDASAVSRARHHLLRCASVRDGIYRAFDPPRATLPTHARTPTPYTYLTRAYFLSRLSYRIRRARSGARTAARRRGGRPPQRARARATPSPARPRCIIATHKNHRIGPAAN